MRRKPRPPAPDTRQPWQVEQAAHCPCRGTDDMCPCQNENPWPRPRRDLEGEVRTLELQQQTDRQTIASLLCRAEAAEARALKAEQALEEARGALEPFAAFMAANDADPMSRECRPDHLTIVAKATGQMRDGGDQFCVVTWGHFRRASSVHEKLKERGS